MPCGYFLLFYVHHRQVTRSYGSGNLSLCAVFAVRTSESWTVDHCSLDGAAEGFRRGMRFVFMRPADSRPVKTRSLLICMLHQSSSGEWQKWDFGRNWVLAEGRGRESLHIVFTRATRLLFLARYYEIYLRVNFCLFVSTVSHPSLLCFQVSVAVRSNLFLQSYQFSSINATRAHETTDFK